MKRLFDFLDVKNHGYKVNKWLTNSSLLVIFLYALFVFSVDGSGVFLGSQWVECPEDSLHPCINPYYDSTCEFTGVECEQKYLFAGEIVGEKPSVYAESFGWFSFLLFGSSLLLNHLLYNNNWKVKKN
jgi:hypothetical protein